MLPRLLILVILAPVVTMADDIRTEFSGHTKLRLVAQTYPSNSVFSDLFGDNSLDSQAEVRLNILSRMGSWTIDANYQLAALNGEIYLVADDRRRLLDLTSVIDESGRSTIVHRLDRFSLGYTTDKTVIRLGRQALSWGNGLFYAPMDLVNPFDPASIDTEYKTGDDMLYAQYLRDDGSDLQGAYVFRRDLQSGNVEFDAATAALKYHGFSESGEYDVLVAESHGDKVVGAGFGRSIGGAIWSADVVVTDTEADTYIQLVTNLSYSWIFADKNMSGAVEYYYNGFGQRAGRYDPLALASNSDLTVRLTRGELFGIGRHYIAGSVMIEMTPLWSVSPTILANVSDPSGLLQLVTNYSLADNMTLLGSINLPMGSDGSEFGGISSGVADRYLSTDLGVFAQFAWYF